MGKLARFGKVLLNSFVAIWRGEFLLRLRAGRFLAHILYTFLLFGLIIWVSLLIDTSHRGTADGAVRAEIRYDAGPRPCRRGPPPGKDGLPAAGTREKRNPDYTMSEGKKKKDRIGITLYILYRLLVLVSIAVVAKILYL